MPKSANLKRRHRRKVRRAALLHPSRRERQMALLQKTVNFDEIAALLGFRPGPDGRLNIPATQEVADKIEAVTMEAIGHWNPGDDHLDLTITGAAPVWAYLKWGHALHGRVVKLTYSSPNATIVIFRHGVA